ncbi:MAG: sigma-70 family RNA polymerase sigma factor [Bryobacteraceae bacterium]
MIQDIGHEFNEAALVAQAQQGGVEAFTHLVNQYERNVFRLARHITQNLEDAEDVLQETFLKAYQHLGDFQGNSKFYTWLVRIAVNQSLMKLRKRKSDASVSLDDGFDTGADTIVREIAVWDPNPEQTYSREEVREILEKAIESLPEPFRTVFALRDIEGLSTEETRLREKLSRYFKRKGEEFHGYM